MKSVIPFYAMLTLVGALTAGAEDYPAHIVQPLPKELDPRLEPALQAPADVARPLNAAETAQMNEAARHLDHTALMKDAQNAMKAGAAEDAAVDQLIDGFRREHHVTIHAAPAEPAPIAAPAATDDADIYHINCADGVFFDMEQGLLVYMKNVSLTHPRVSLQCEGPLKIYLTQKEQKAPAPKKEKSGPELTMPNGGNFDFDSLKKASASGKVVVHYTDEKGAKSTAKAEKITYDATTGEIILAGGYPTITSDGHSVRCPHENGFIRIYGNGSIYISEGAETTIRDVNKQLSNQQKPKTTR